MPRGRILAAAAGAIALVVAAYANFFHNDFHFDDSHVIVENVAIRSLDDWPRFFTDVHTFSSLPQNATYRPLVTLSYAVDYAVSGRLNPVPFHVTQLALLLVVSALLALIATRLLGNALAGIGAAALFAVHTANTETMNFLSSRSELLSAVGFLLALQLFIASPRARRFHLYLIPLLIGALAKAPVVIFALVVVAWVRIVERRPWRDAILVAMPSLVAGIVALVLLNRMNAPEWQSGGGSAWHYVITQPFVWLHYARLAILPAGLTADTDLQPFRHWYETAAIAGYAFLALLLYAIRKAPAAIAFGLAFFAITLLPTSLFPLAEVANEHRLFFPLMGFAIAAVAFLMTKRRAYALLVVALIAMAIGTHYRNRIWATEETLWKDVTEKSPRNGRGWMNYGLSRMADGKLQEAKTLFDRAAQETPNYSTLEINRGIVTAALGDHATAEYHFQRALTLSRDRSSHFFYGRWLLQQGRASEAQEHLRTAERMAPTWSEPKTLLHRIAIARGSTPPDLGCASYDRCFANGLAARGALDAAVSYRAALQYRQHADAWNNLGWSLASMGFRDDARKAYEEALCLDPGYERARNNLRAL